jgi:hypothetical protein
MSPFFVSHCSNLFIIILLFPIRNQRFGRAFCLRLQDWSTGLYSSETFLPTILHGVTTQRPTWTLWEPQMKRISKKCDMGNSLYSASFDAFTCPYMNAFLYLNNLVTYIHFIYTINGLHIGLFAYSLHLFIIILYHKLKDLTTDNM